VLAVLASFKEAGRDIRTGTKSAHEHMSPESAHSILQAAVSDFFGQVGARKRDGCKR